MRKRRYQAFVSSTYTDLIEERKEVNQAILENGCFPAGMELFPAADKTQWDIIKTVIDDSDFYIVIIGGKYGSIGVDDDGNKISYTEMEFDYAVKTNKPVIALIHEDIGSLPKKKLDTVLSKNIKLTRFMEKAKSGRLVKFWTNKDNLKAAALYSISALINETENNMSGWVYAKDLESQDDSDSYKPNDVSVLISGYQKQLRTKEEKIEELERFILDCYENPSLLEDEKMKIKIEEAISLRESMKEQEYLDELAKTNRGS